jgi:hypothetical protein
MTIGAADRGAVNNPDLTGRAIENAEQRVDSAMHLVREALDGLAAHLRKYPDSQVGDIPPRVRQALCDALTSYDDVNGFFVRVSRG